MKIKWIKDRDPLVPAHVLKWYSFYGEVFKDDFGNWDWIIWYRDVNGQEIEETSVQTFNTLREAKKFVEKQLFEYQTKIVASIGKI